MLNDLNPSQRALADYMSELSELAYHAGWMKGTEFALWNAVMGRLKQYGRLEITDEIVRHLKELSSECSGWIVFDEKTEETFLPLNEWINMREWHEEN
jgi:hypothetical protein